MASLINHYSYNLCAKSLKVDCWPPLLNSGEGAKFPERPRTFYSSLQSRRAVHCSFDFFAWLFACALDYDGGVMMHMTIIQIVSNNIYFIDIYYEMLVPLPFLSFILYDSTSKSRDFFLTRILSTSV